MKGLWIDVLEIISFLATELIHGIDTMKILTKLNKVWKVALLVSCYRKINKQRDVMIIKVTWQNLIKKILGMGGDLITETVAHFKGVFGKRCSEICSKFTGEHPCQSVISTNLLWNFIEIALRQGWSPLKLLHIFGTAFYKNTSGQVFL